MPAPDNQFCTKLHSRNSGMRKPAVDELYPRLSTQRQRPA